MVFTVAIDPALLRDDGTYIPQKREEQINFIRRLVRRVEGLPCEIDYQMRLNDFLKYGGTKPKQVFKARPHAATQGIEDLILREKDGKGVSEALQAKIHELRRRCWKWQNYLKVIVDSQPRRASAGTKQGEDKEAEGYGWLIDLLVVFGM